MNTYSKYCPNVFVAKCTEEHQRGETITLTTKYGQEHECIVFNLVHRDKEGNFYYSIVRADGYNIQERAKRKAERLNQWASNAEKRSDEWREKANEGKDFLVLAEPIKIGHHSEKRHRALIERNHNRFSNAMAELDKAAKLSEKAEYWEGKTEEINLSMPESIEYYEFKLEEAKQIHADFKSGKRPKEHSFSLTYAKKEVNKFQDLLNTAIKLWGEKI